METINFTALLVFVFATTFTPGPNNISSSSMGILYGYRKTVKYLLGIMLGFFVIMTISGIVSQTLLSVFPSLETGMRIVGALYILWLAFKTVRSSYQLNADDAPALGFVDGMLLQALNPKVWVYGVTLYTTFLAAISNHIVLLLISALLLASVSFMSTTTWTLSAAAIKRFLRKPKFQSAVNIVLALLLVWTAFELSGIPALLAG